ncbi:MAG: hypothetical protein JSV09_13200 [Thermoplasmata archaeon]|nr:MAG: hypothetical protein JSV09_13200 [Thermoplasmata archaeon]
MVNQRFIKILNKSIKKQLKKVINGEPAINVVGSHVDQYEGFLATLEAHFLRKAQEYDPHEFVHARVPIKNQYFSYMDITVPVVNIKKNSVQGVATFFTEIPYPINETYILRRVGLSNKLVPHNLVFKYHTDPRKIIKEGLINSEAIKDINNDRKLIKKLKGNDSCLISCLGSDYSATINLAKYPPGMFTIVPYYNHSFLIAKDAGISLEATTNEPRYHIRDRYQALFGVAHCIARKPQVGETVGKFYLDISMRINLPPILEQIKNNAR